MRVDAVPASLTVQNRKIWATGVSRAIPEAVSERFRLVLGNKFDMGARRMGVKLGESVLLATK